MSAEQRWAEQLDLLRRALVCSSLAAEGIDPSIETFLAQMRDSIRQEDFTGSLGALLPRLERALLQYETRRQERLQSVKSLLQNMARQVKSLPLQGTTEKALREFEKTLNKTPPSSQVLVSLLTQLSSVQQAAIEELSVTPVKQGLLSRLFGGASKALPVLDKATGQEQILPKVAQAAKPSSLEPLAAASATEAKPTLVSTADASALAPEPALEPLHKAQDQVSPETPIGDAHDLDVHWSEHRLPVVNAVISAAEIEQALAQEGSEEPVYSNIAEHVQSTLLKLLDELKAPDDFAAQVNALQQRILAGLNLYELVAVLDDLAALVLEVTGNGAQAFEGYLLKLNERLNSFQTGLESAGTGYAASVNAARALDQAVSQQVSDLQDCLSQAASLEALQQAVEARLETVRQTMAGYQQSVTEHEQTVGLHLQDLSLRVQKMEQEAKTFHEHLEQQRQLALIDSLTGLPNRAAWRERLQSEVARWQRHGGELCLAVVDVDLFKRINDQYGHLAGDKVLKIIAHELRKRLRKSDFIARFGGEEFALLLPVTSLSAAQTVLETLRTGVELCPFNFKGERITITVSAGIAAFAQGDSAEEVFERADKALYRAKDLGRNQVQIGACA